jgi:hypothetical protein
MSDQAGLLVIDYLVPIDSEPHPAKGMDMAMLILPAAGNAPRPSWRNFSAEPS